MTLHADDVLWLVGDKLQIAGLKQVHGDLETKNGEEPRFFEAPRRS